MRRAELTRAAGAVRRAGRIAVDTGTGITMSPSANVTQWLGVGADDRHGFDEPPRRGLVPPGFAYQLETLRAAGLAAGGILRARAAQPSGDAGVPAGMAVRGTGRRDPRRQHPRRPQPRRQPRHRVPRRRRPGAGAARSSTCWPPSRSSPTRRRRSRRTCCPPRISSSGPTSRCGTSCCPRVAAQHTPAVVDPVGERRSTWWVLAETRPAARPRAGRHRRDATDERDARAIAIGGRCPYDELAANGWAEARRRTARAVGRRPRRPAGRLAAGAPPPRRPAGRAARARAARVGAPPAAPPAELAARLPRRGRRDRRSIPTTRPRRVSTTVRSGRPQRGTAS